MTAIFATLMIALMAVGFAYATWFDSVFINATATTGDVELRITRFGVCSQSPGPTWTGEGWYSDVDEITVTVDNTYPGWWAYVCLQVKNTGTISIKLYGIQIVRTGGHAGLMDYYRYGIPEGDTWCAMHHPVYFNYTFTTWSTEHLYDVLGLPTVTIAPGASKVLGGFFYLDPTTPSGYENTALTVRITLKAVQAVP